NGRARCRLCSTGVFDDFRTFARGTRLVEWAHMRVALAVLFASCTTASVGTTPGEDGAQPDVRTETDAAIAPAVDAGNDAAVPPSIWTPAPRTSWQWQLTGTIDTRFDVAMYDIDLFDAPQSVIDSLHASGRIVICYFSAGSYENWRPDTGDFPTS